MAELSIRVKLKAGNRYIIVPTTKELDKEGKYFLSLYFSCELHDVDIQRIGHPSERYAFIMEEYEKAERMVPKWKVNWVKHIIKNKYIIVKDD